MTGECLATCYGHSGEISKVSFNPNGRLLLTASSDKTARLWDTDTGECSQRLQGHEDEIFSCAFNYEGNTIITGSKDNSCRIWKSDDSIRLNSSEITDDDLYGYGNRDYYGDDYDDEYDSY